MDRKEKSEKVINSGSRYGGNRKLQTFRNCQKCGKEFGPLNNLKRIFCSKMCMYDSREIKKFHIPTKEARNAQRLIKYYVDKGKIIRPTLCEKCKKEYKRIEAAHFDYKEPMKVRWLCRGCHVRWDKQEPKHGTIIKRWEDYTGQKAIKVV